jgi:carboxyl-terminal processing protease
MLFAALPLSSFLRRVTFTACCMFVGGAAAQSTPTESPLPLDELRTFTQVYDHVRSGYVRDISDKELLEFAIKGMIAELDPHSAYLNKTEFADLQESTNGEFGGVGLEVSLDEGFVRVITPIDDSPSARAGIQSGDIITRIDNTPVKGMDLNKAINMMRGPKGTKVTLSVTREGVSSPLEFTLERAIIKVQSVRTRSLQNDYFYLRIAQFQSNTGREAAKKLQERLKKFPETKGIILDLRNNPGGVLQASVELTDLFLDGGMVVYTQGRLENSNVSYHAEAGDLTNGLPMVVLINDGSASASEIVAGALQDHKRAIIMGTRSFGKGSVQSVIPISNERAVKLTTALYYTPNGRSIQAQGIEPDVDVERVQIASVAKSMQTTEADLAGHINNTRGGNESNRQSRDARRITNAELLREDNQLHEALNLLKGLRIFMQTSPLAPAALIPAVDAPVLTE